MSGYTLHKLHKTYAGPGKESHERISASGNVLPKSLICAECGIAYPPYRVGSKWCSKVCRNKHHNRKRAVAGYFKARRAKD